MSWTPPPGTIGLTYSYGLTAFRASFGQRLLGETSAYNHAFVVIGNDLAIEPWPTGARVIDINEYAGEYVAYGWLPGLTAAQRSRLVQAATSLLGVGYGLLDYAALATYRSGSRRGRVTRRVRGSGRLLPAQFVVETYRRAGVHLMPDSNPYAVTLDEVGELFLTSTDWELRVPCALYV